MKQLITICFGLMLGLGSFNAQAGFLKEFGFCPLGGPPGWFNRFTNQRPPVRLRYYPAYYPQYYQSVINYRYPAYPQYRYPSYR